MAGLKAKEEAKYATAFAMNEQFVEELTAAENERFEQLFEEW